MNDKEILADLKIAYERLLDTEENNDKKLNKKQINKLRNILNDIAEIYSDFRETLSDDKMQVIINEKEYYIGNCVNEDFTERYDEVNKCWLLETCGDLDYYWYYDREFLKK